MGICIECKKRDIVYKKRGLCGTCYHRLYRQGLICTQHDNKISNECEIIFIKSYFNHNEWIYEPCRFKIGNTTYTPDFYDQRDNIFIEVVGTRQAFSNSKNKYIAFMRTYPKLNLKLMRKDGSEIFIPEDIKNGKMDSKLWRISL